MARRGMIKNMVVMAALVLPATATTLVAGQQCTEALEDSCLSCHALARTCRELGQDKKYWRDTVVRMARYAPSISEEVQKTLISCLAKEKRDVQEACRQ